VTPAATAARRSDPSIATETGAWWYGRSIDSFLEGRDNSFNLLRFLGALTVLFSHSFVLSGGVQAKEPAQPIIGDHLSALGVHAFFAISGFLITLSAMRRPNAVRFVVARLRRIYPGLMVCVALTVVVAGFFLTSMPAFDFFRLGATWEFLWGNASLLGVRAAVLPWVFTDNPLPAWVNGSLWTLPYEMICYGLILGLILIRGATRPGIRLGFLLAGCIVLSVGVANAESLQQWLPMAPGPAVGLRYMQTFLAGALLAAASKRLRLSGAMLTLAIVVVAGCLWFHYFGWLFKCAFAYALIGLALLPGGPIRAFNRLGDYSYGLYIYAFPVQQSLVFWFPGVSAIGLFFAAAGISLPLAVLSWHAVEKPMLRGKLRMTSNPAKPASL